MESNLKKLLAGIISFALLFTLGGSFYVAAEEVKTHDVWVTLVAQEAGTISVLVDSNHVEQVKKDFQAGRLALPNLGYKYPEPTPPSSHAKLMGVDYVDYNKALQVMENISSKKDYDKLLDALGSGVVSVIFDAISTIFNKAGLSIVGVVVSVVGFLADVIRENPDKWWQDSIDMILKHQINAVEISYWENTSGIDYPKAWRILRRI